MNIQIEYYLIETSQETIIQFNYLLKMVKKMHTLQELKNWEQLEHINLFKIGFGSQHCWVKQFDNNGTLSNERLLSITES